MVQFPSAGLLAPISRCLAYYLFDKLWVYHNATPEEDDDAAVLCAEKAGATNVDRTIDDERATVEERAEESVAIETVPFERLGKLEP